jgi:ABC-2 type transport system ATP-binding protein
MTASSSTPAAELTGVVHRYRGDGGRPVEALAGVDLTLSAVGELTVLVGVNGCGKTTLLRVLAAALAPSEGRVALLGHRSPAAGGRRPPRSLLRRLADVPQDPALDPEMRGGETLRLMAVLYGLPRRRRRARIAEVAVAFGLGELMDRPVATLSGGQRRRLHLAAGLLHEPDLLLLDEPAAGLDAGAREALWAELARRAGAGATIVVVSHALAEVERHAARVVMLDAGRVVADGAPAALLAESGATDLADLFRRRTGHDPAELEPKPKRRGGRR